MIKRIIVNTFKALVGFILFVVVVSIAMDMISPKKQNKVSEEANRHISELRDVCETYVKMSVTNKSTLDLSVFGSSGWLGDDGNYYATQEFSAKNKFGLEQKFKALCTKKTNGKSSFRIEELYGS